jgi:hypothetical protein
MRKNAQKVLNCFAQERACKEDTIRTDGQRVFSYGMLVARRTSTGIELIEYNRAPSATTRSHVRALEQYFPKEVRVHEFEITAW